MLACVISVGVKTWGAHVVALRRYRQMTDDLGYARITYGDGLWEWTHDGWTMLGALLTRRARLGPAVNSCFDPSSHHPSWLAEHAVAADRLSGGRLDLRLAVGAEDSRAAATCRSHAIAYPDAAAGATDLMLGFADFQATRMVEVFAERVLPFLASRR